MDQSFLKAPSLDIWPPPQGSLTGVPISHLGVGAHPDDLEILAIPAIAHCYQHPRDRFGGVVCTSGSGSARTGPYRDLSAEGMCRVRREEQREAARLGRYGLLVQLGYESSSLRDSGRADLEHDLTLLLDALRPRHVLTHNPADRHDTHVAVLFAVLAACHNLKNRWQPESCYGVEVWRSLDWACHEDRVTLDAGAQPALSRKLLGVFRSQIGGGKRYDLAALGRRWENATFSRAHEVDELEQAVLAVDLLPVVRGQIPLEVCVEGMMRRFCDDVRARLERCRS